MEFIFVKISKCNRLYRCRRVRTFNDAMTVKDLHN